MIAPRTCAAALIVLPLLGCGDALGLRRLANDPDAGVAGSTGPGGRGGAGGSAVQGGSGTAGQAGGLGAGGRGGSGQCPGGLLAYYPFDNDTNDHSGNGRDIVATDVSPTAGAVGNAYVFNGTTSAMRVTGGADLPLSDRTLCAWVKPDSVAGLAQPVFAAGSAGQGDVFSLASSTPGTIGADCELATAGEIFVDHEGARCTVGSGLAAPSGQWSFVCYLFTGTTTEPLFVGPAYYVAQGSSRTYPLSSLTVGSNSIGGNNTGPVFSGAIDEVTIWEGAISPAEESALMTNSLTLVSCGTSGPPPCSAAPVVALTPGQTPALTAGDATQFDLSITNANLPTCPADTYYYAQQAVSATLLVTPPSGQVALAGGQTTHVTLQASSDPAAHIGGYQFSYVVSDLSTSSGHSFASATYLVGSARVSTGFPLIADGDGHYDGSNAAGVVGYWWSTGDAYGMDAVLGDGTCQADGFPAADCSVLTTPAPGTLFRPDPGGRGMCTSGVSAQVINDATGSPAYGAIWGDVIAFDLNNPGSFPAGPPTRLAYDAPAHGVTGFAFDIDAVPAMHMRITFQTVGTENSSAYWDGATSDDSPILTPGHYEMRWPEIGGPKYLTNPPPFDPTQLESITFFVYSNAVAPVPFSYCITNVMLLTN